jgi:hypothetical protein
MREKTVLKGRIKLTAAVACLSLTIVYAATSCYICVSVPVYMLKWRENSESSLVGKMFKFGILPLECNSVKLRHYIP